MSYCLISLARLSALAQVVLQDQDQPDWGADPGPGSMAPKPPVLLTDATYVLTER